MIKILTNLTHKIGESPFGSVSSGRDQPGGAANYELYFHFTSKFQALPSLEDQLAEVERLIERTEKELEEYLNE